MPSFQTTRSRLKAICEGDAQPGYDVSYPQYEVTFRGLKGERLTKVATVKTDKDPVGQAIRQVLAQHCKDMGKKPHDIGLIISQYLAKRRGKIWVDKVAAPAVPKRQATQPELNLYA